MRLLDSIRRSGRNLRHAKLRTALTMLAISVGAFALMLTLAAGEGARQLVDRLVSSNFNPNIMYVYRTGDQEEDPFSNEVKVKEYKEEDASGTALPSTAVISEDDIKKMQTIKDVDRVVPTVQPGIQYVSGANSKKFQATVYSLEADSIEYKAIAGSIPASLPRNQLAIPEAFVESMGFTSPQDAIGKKLSITYDKGVESPGTRTYTIVGVAKKPNGLQGGARGLLMSQAELENAYRLQQGSKNQQNYPAAAVYAKNDQASTIDGIKNELKKSSIQALSAKDLAKQITQVVNIVQYFVAGFGVIALIVSIFGIVNTQLISVLERTRQIGLMKALGMSGRGVLRLFTFEAIWIGFGGAIIGIGGAYAAAMALNPFLDKKLELGGNLLVLEPSHAILLTLALMFIAAMAGLLPAWKAARLNPIEALRTE